jgi:hypothetical protein
VEALVLRRLVRKLVDKFVWVDGRTGCLGVDQQFLPLDVILTKSMVDW